jgi:predicted RNA-binding protein YlqC (UPF0109 family)
MKEQVVCQVKNRKVRGDRGIKIGWEGRVIKSLKGLLRGANSLSGGRPEGQIGRENKDG